MAVGGIGMGVIIFLTNVLFSISFLILAFSAFVFSINAMSRRFIPLFVCGVVFAILCAYCAYNAIIVGYKCFLP